MRGRAEPGPHPGFCLEQVEGDSPASRPDSCFSSLRDSFSFRLHQIGDTFRSQSSQDKVPGSTFPRSFPLAVPPGGPRGPALLQSHQAWAPAQGVSPATGRPPAALREVLPRCSGGLAWARSRRLAGANPREQNRTDCDIQGHTGEDRRAAREGQAWV